MGTKNITRIAPRVRRKFDGGRSVLHTFSQHRGLDGAGDAFRLYFLAGRERVLARRPSCVVGHLHNPFGFIFKQVLVLTDNPINIDLRSNEKLRVRDVVGIVFIHCSSLHFTKIQRIADILKNG